MANTTVIQGEGWDDIEGDSGLGKRLTYRTTNGWAKVAA